jgi:biopolymer transport protein ExbD
MDLRGRSKVTTEFSMSSMTDLIFLLLIFFIITSTMVNPNAIKLLLPKSSTQTRAPQSVEVAIDAELRFYVKNKEVSFELLPNAINQELNNIKLKGDREESAIALSADKSVPVEQLVKVMNIARDLKLKVILRTGRE